MQEIIHVWQWQQYWKGHSPLADRIGSVEGSVFVEGAGVGICSADLGTCCFYARVWPAGPLNPEGFERPASAQPNGLLLAEFLRTKTAREQALMPPEISLDTSNRLDPRPVEQDPIAAKAIRFDVPALLPPRESILPKTDSAKIALLNSVISGVRTTRMECSLLTADVPFLSESDGEALVLVRGERCTEVVRLLRWGSREWRAIDHRAADPRIEQLIRAALWKTVDLR